ncbi:MAG: glycosyltransferase [Caldimonas sp.]
MLTARSPRLLFCSSGGAGHLRPLLPLAHAALRHGHQVLWVTAPDAIGELSADGIETCAGGLSTTAARVVYRHRWPEWAELRGEALGAHTYPRLFGGVIAPAMLPALELAIDDFRPDLVVHEVAALAAPLACARRGLRHCTHGIGLPQPPAQLRAAAVQVNELWIDAGLAPPPDGGVYAHQYVDIAPPALARYADAPAGQVRALSPSATALPSRHRLPLPIAARLASSSLPRVYLSFGTVFQGSDAFIAAARALARLPVLGVITAVDAERCQVLRVLGPDIHVVPYTDQADVMAHCEIVVSHGGAGTVLGACTSGRPQLVLPQAADHFRNARALERAGAARVLQPAEATEDGIVSTLFLLLKDDDARHSAQAIAREIAAMPSADDVVEALIVAN